MKGFDKIGYQETEVIYADVKRLVSTWVDNKNPDLDVAPFSQCVPGLDYYSIPLIGTNSGFDDLTALCISLDRAFDGAKLADEPLPDGSRRYYVNIPLYVPKGKQHHRNNAGAGSNGKPSEVWLMFLVMVEVVSGVILYFRLQ